MVKWLGMVNLSLYTPALHTCLMPNLRTGFVPSFFHPWTFLQCTLKQNIAEMSLDEKTRYRTPP